jgi:hypothetical protein
MAMSRRDFEAMATAFGAALRSGDGVERVAVWECVDAFCRVAVAGSPAFSENRFLAWVGDVADGTRDLDGKRVKGAVSA